MQIEIINKKGHVLRSITHNGQLYVEAPPQGAYKIRLRNTSAERRLAVVSVDGVNVLDGKDAGYDGQGYVLRPWETIDIPGWRRSGDSVARFEFSEKGGSYSAQTGRGVNNVGVIGVAVFDEAVPVYVPSPIVITTTSIPIPPSPWTWGAGTTGNNVSSAGVNIRCARSHAQGETNCSSGTLCAEDASGTYFAAKNDVPDVGTAYGRETSFYTTSTEFHRATKMPALVLSLRYATRERLKSWGVPIEVATKSVPAPNPFPVSQPSVPAPPNWHG